MKGRYQNFGALALNERNGVDYQIKSRQTDSPFAIIAPHGGRIEHGTSQIADAIAGDEHAFYAFEGLKDLSHDLHIASNRFDEPRALQLAHNARIVITVHGCRGHSPGVFLGGRHEWLKELLLEALRLEGFPAQPDPHPKRQGTHLSNICNHGQTGEGVQIEMTQAFRRALFEKPDYYHTHWQPNDCFHHFSDTIKTTLSYQEA